MKKMISIRLDEIILKKIDAAAAAARRTRTNMIESILFDVEIKVHNAKLNKKIKYRNETK